MIAGELEPQLPLCRVPISPRAALLRSFLVPGLGQLQLERPRAAGFFAIIEVGSIGMTVKSLRDLRLAKDARADTIATPVLDPVTGEPALDPATGEPRVTWAPRNPVIADRVRARRTHLEDWMAVVVFNHLISGADAFVAAYLADFNTNVQISAAGPRDLSVAARVFW